MKKIKVKLLSDKWFYNTGSNEGIVKINEVVEVSETIYKEATNAGVKFQLIENKPAKHEDKG